MKKSKRKQRKKPVIETASAEWLCSVIDKHCLQIIKGGYRWRDYWEVREPAPGGHYMECAERMVGHGPTAKEALESAIESLGEAPPELTNREEK